MRKLSYPLPRAIRWTDFSVLSSSPGAAVEGLMPMQMREFYPRVPSKYR